MSERACPSEVDLDQAFSLGTDPQIEAHLASCETCHAWWADTTLAVELARELPVEVPSARHREELRTSVLAAKPPARPALRRARVMPALALAAAAAVLVIATRPHAPKTRVAAADPHPRRGTVHGHLGASYALAAAPPDELVRLRDGTIDVDVDPLHEGERFRVIVGADEVEVRGTSFEIVAAADHLISVRVVHGRVEVRHIGSAQAVLTAGQAWHADSLATTQPLPLPPPPVPTIAPPPIAPPSRVAVTMPPPAPKREAPAPVAPAPAPVPVAPAPKPPADPQEVAFVSGWDSMRKNDFRQAAAAFARAVALDPSGTLAEDGAFWHAVALARIPRKADAVVALRGFVEDYPTSTRAGEASAMLGWMLVEQGEADEARRRFTEAIKDPSTSIQTSARKGLQTLDGAKP